MSPAGNIEVRKRKAGNTGMTDRAAICPAAPGNCIKKRSPGCSPGPDASPADSTGTQVAAGAGDGMAPGQHGSSRQDGAASASLNGKFVPACACCQGFMWVNMLMNLHQH